MSDQVASHEIEEARRLVENQRAELDATLAKLAEASNEEAGVQMPADARAAPAEEELQEAAGDVISAVAVERELNAATSLREEKAAIRARAQADEANAESAYQTAKAQISADVAYERASAEARLRAADLERLRVEARIKREARERAELVYSTDLSRAVGRLRAREAALDSARVNLSSAYDRQRMYDATRRLRLARISLSDQVVDYDYRGRRLAALYDYPVLFDGLASRYYDTLAPYAFPLSSAVQTSAYLRARYLL